MDQDVRSSVRVIGATVFCFRSGLSIARALESLGLWPRKSSYSIQHSHQSQRAAEGACRWQCELRISTRLASVVAIVDHDWHVLVYSNAAADAVAPVVPISDAFMVRTPAFADFPYQNIHRHLPLMDSILCYYGESRPAPHASAIRFAVVVAYLRHFTSHIHPGLACYCIYVAY